MKNALRRRAILALVLGTAAVAANAQARLVPDKSEIAFTSKQMGVPVDGRFRKFDAQVDFDPKKPEGAKIGLTVDLGSATVGSAETDAELGKAEWFNVKAFPQATFQSSAVKSAGGGHFEVTGKLSIKSIGQSVVVPVTLVQAGGVTTASGSFTIKRLDFHVGEGDWKDTSVVGDPVLVHFKLVLSGVGAL